MNTFIQDALDYYQHKHNVDIRKLFKKDSESDYFIFCKKKLVWNELVEIYKIGLKEYNIEINFNEFLSELCVKKKYIYKRPKLEKTSFRQIKNNKISKKDRIQTKKRIYGSSKSYKKKYKSFMVKYSHKQHRNWTKKQILKDNFSIFDNNNDTDYKIFTDPWGWD